MVTAVEIIEKAKEFGYDKCGIVPLDRMAGYEDKLNERMERFPETRERYEGLRKFAYPQKKFPWARSVVVCSFWCGKYRIPKNLHGHIAGFYLTDMRHQINSPGYQASLAFEKFLGESGLRLAFDRDFGITSLRWAAQEAGLGLIRKNNFFYTEKGSFQYLEAFLIDEPLEYKETCVLKPCSHNCRKCIQACPTHALDRPYSMNRNRCVSDLTTWSGWDLTSEPLHSQLGGWIYGCDACQDACPYNQKVEEEKEEYPGLEKLSEELSLLRIVQADYTYLEEVLQPILWYIPAEKSRRYKTNALNAMLNDYKPEYHPIIRNACEDEKEPVRRMARWVLQQIEQNETECLL